LTMGRGILAQWTDAVGVVRKAQQALH
jgi:hypothetical protein